jgi:DNA-binding response OmpR family regulator
VILDLSLPDISGYQVCARRSTFNQVVPIIIPRRRVGGLDKIAASAGADIRDQIAVFRRRELLARIKAILRHAPRSGGARQGPRPSSSAAAINLKKHTPTHLPGRVGADADVHEVELAKMLYDAPISRCRATDPRQDLWGIGLIRQTPSIARRQAAQKLEENQHHHWRHILTVYGYGYKLVP